MKQTIHQGGRRMGKTLLTHYLSQYQHAVLAAKAQHDSLLKEGYHWDGMDGYSKTVTPKEALSSANYADIEARIMAHSGAAVRVLLKMKNVARAAQSPLYPLIKRQLLAAMYGMPLRKLHEMAKETQNGVNR